MVCSIADSAASYSSSVADRQQMEDRLRQVRDRIGSLERQLENLESSHDTYLRESQSLTDRCNLIADRITPLGKEHDRARKTEKIARYTGLGSGMLVTIGPLLSTMGHPMAGMAVFLADAVVLGASFLATHWARRTMAEKGPQFDAGFAQWQRTKSEIDTLQAYHRGDVARMNALASDIKSARGEENVIGMALSMPIEQPPLPEIRVDQQDESITIGNLRIPRRRLG